MNYCLGVIGFLCSLAAAGAEPPNILVLISDDQNINSLGCYGGKYETPHIDRLAEEGMRFTRAYTVSTLCVPTRYSILTASYPSRCRNSLFGEYDVQPSIRNGAFFCDTDRTIAQALQRSGCFTGASGKWHNDFHDLFSLHEIPRDADPRDPEIVKLLQATKEETRQLMAKYGFDYAECITQGNLSDYPDALDHHNVEYTVKGALDFLDQAPEDKPFFLWTAFTTTHGPRERIDSADVTVTPEGITDIAVGVMPPRSTFIAGNENWVEKQTVLWMDAGIGVILDKLRAMGELDNTLVVFLADQQNAAKATPYEAGAKIPFIARWPGVIPAGTVSDTLIDTTDLGMTIMDVAGAEPIEDMQTDGVSILPVWKGETEQLKTAVYGESGFARSVVTRDWKYIAIRYNQESLDRGFVPPQS
jgi:arylsulfatase A-like enzyme